MAWEWARKDGGGGNDIKVHEGAKFLHTRSSSISDRQVIISFVHFAQSKVKYIEASSSSSSSVIINYIRIDFRFKFLPLHKKIILFYVNEM